MKATIVNTVENTTKVVDLSEAVTDLAGLKHFLSIGEGQFFEGSTHTDLTSDTQVLPTLPESKKDRGYVIFVSPAQNKIKNGAYDRKGCYVFIKSHNLGEKVKELYNRNFTQVSTDALNAVIAAYGAEGEDVSSHSNESSEPHGISEPHEVADPDAGKITTEKALWEALVDAVKDSSDESKIQTIKDGIDRVFPDPYSVQDLNNMRN